MCVPLNWIRTTKTTERLSKVSEPSLSCLMWILLMIKKKNNCKPTTIYWKYWKWSSVRAVLCNLCVWLRCVLWAYRFGSRRPFECRRRWWKSNFKISSYDTIRAMAMANIQRNTKNDWAFSRYVRLIYLSMLSSECFNFVVSSCLQRLPFFLFYAKNSLNHIAELNAKRAKDVHNNSHQFSAKYGVTPYSDLTENEFLSLHLSKPIALRTKMNQSTDDGSNGPATITTNDGRPLTDYEKYNYVYADKKRVEHALPDKIDWWVDSSLSPFAGVQWTNEHLFYSRRDKNYVPSVRKQGLCGACWAYSIISNIESQLAIQNVTQASLSIQQMIDCAKDGNTGCSGGNACDLLEWLTANKVKIETESEYPMLEEGSGDCKADPNPKEFYQIVDFKCFR